MGTFSWHVYAAILFAAAASGVLLQLNKGHLLAVLAWAVIVLMMWCGAFLAGIQHHRAKAYRRQRERESHA